MSIKVEPEQALLTEVAGVLFQHLPPSKVARFLAGWQLGSGDYLEIRRELFGRETPQSLFEKVQAFEQAERSQPAADSEPE